MSLWLYCHFPQLLLDTMRRIHPAIDDYPVAFYQQQKQHKELVTQCNLKATKMGVEKGQTQVLAQTIASDLICHPYSADKESQALKCLADRLYQSVDKQVLFQPQGIAIAVDDLLRLYQGLEPLLEHLEERFKELQLTYSFSLAHGPVAAQCLARAGAEQLSADRKAIQRAVGQLSIQQLNWPSKIVEKLYKSGIKQVQQLWAIPAAQIGKRFGANLIDELLQLKGEQQQSYHYYRPAEQFFMSLDLVTEVERWQGLLFPLKRALNELEHYLYQRQKVVRELEIRLHHRQQQQTTVPLKIAGDSWRASQFLQLIQLQMNRYPLKHPVLALTIQAPQLYELSRQSGQLLTEASTHQGDLPELLTRLQARLGENSLHSPSLSSDIRPLRNEKFASAGAVTSVTNSSTAPIKRPLWLLPQSEVIDIQQWTLVEGPERLETGWWDDNPYQRDYWLARDPERRLGWLFFQHQQWFLQGWFS
ncbi:MAG: Y-family DNA polymerase [Pseudomonadota bacterium]